MERESLNVFIAEDEPVVLLGFKTIVEECGYTVAGTASDGNTAIEEVLRLRPDIVIMDINMPDVDGMTVIEEVNRHMAIPSVIITGYRDQALVERADRTGVFGYLQKPVDEYEIHSALKIAMKRFNELQKMQMERDEAVLRLEERKVLERAKGTLMEQFGLNEHQAFKAMQKRSRNSNQKLLVVAQRIIDSEKTAGF